MVRIGVFGQWIRTFGDIICHILPPLGHRKTWYDRLQNIQEFSNPLSYSVVNQSQDRTIYSQIGMGVYQGEAVVLRKWALGTTYPQWMVYKLPDQYLDEIPENISQSLRCLASLLEQCKKQPSLWKNYLRMKDGIELVKWYPELMQCRYKSLLIQDVQNNPVVDKKTQLLTEQLQLKIKQSQQCLNCPYCKRIV